MFASLLDMNIFLYIILLILDLIQGIVFCILVYTDAKNRDMNATNMVLLVIFLGPIGGLIYLVLRRKYEL